MCFSAEASFAAAAVLVPIGLYTTHQALRSDRAYLGFATFPLFFGIQQFLEGFVWLSIGEGTGSAANWSAVWFLFFAYLFWPVFVPFSVWLTERDQGRRVWFRGTAIAGGVLGLVLLAPILADNSSVAIHVERNSIRYVPDLVWVNTHAQTVFRVVYALIVCVPLLMASNPKVRFFGVLITISVVLGFLLVSYAFTSVWCFFAALLSAYIVVIIRDMRRRAGLQMESP